MKRPLLVPIICFLFGILASNLTGISAAGTYAPVIVCAPVLAVFFLIAAIKKQKLFFFLLCLFFFLLGILRFTGSMAPEENDISRSISRIHQKVVIYGTVAGEAEWKGDFYARRLVFPLKTERLLMKGDERAVTGTVIVQLFAARKIPQLGEKLVVGGKISLPAGKRNPAGFNYKAHLNRMGVRAVMSSSKNDHYLRITVKKGPVLSIRRSLSAARSVSDNIIKKHLWGRARAVTRSVVLGLRSEITNEISDIFVRTGTMHILAVSGLHIGIVGAIIIGSLHLVRCPRNIIFLLAILGICAFALFTGIRTSSIRAALMGSFVFCSMLLERKTDVVYALVLSALIIIFLQPGQLFMPGFILSYLAVLSIIYVTPLTDAAFGVISRPFKERPAGRFRKYLLRSLSVSFAVWAGMMPVIASYFHIITPSVILSNLLAVPVLFVTVILGFGLLFTGLTGFLSPFANIIAGALNIIISFFMTTMQRISYIPFSFVRVSSPNWALITVFYTALAVVVVLSRRAKKYKSFIVIFFLFAANLFLWSEVTRGAPPSMRVTFFDVGKADASLLEFPDESVMLIDGGSGGKKTGGAGRYVLAPYLWQRGIWRIDGILLTHAHEDHIGGLLYVLKNFNVGTVIDGGVIGELPVPEEKLYKEFIGIIKKKNVRYLTVKRGDVIKGFPGVNFAVLNPPRDRSYGDLNNDSVVVKAIVEKGHSILFCADAESKAMKDMLCFGRMLKSDLLKAPHHAAGLGDGSIIREFVNEVQCAGAVVTNNSPRDLLNADLMEELARQRVDVHVTGESGAVIAEEAGNGLKVRGFCR